MLFLSSGVLLLATRASLLTWWPVSSFEMRVSDSEAVGPTMFLENEDDQGEKKGGTQNSLQEAAAEDKLQNKEEGESKQEEGDEEGDSADEEVGRFSPKSFSPEEFLAEVSRLG